METLTQEELKQIVTYSPRTGVFKWLQAGRGRRLDRSIGTVHSDGYRILGIDGVRYRTHRLAFLYMTGSWPVNQVDHKNGRRLDNRWSNLRDVTNTENAYNRRVTAKKGLPIGVHWCARRSVFRAHLIAGGVVRLDKQFDALEDAQAAYARAKLIHHTIM